MSMFPEKPKPHEGFEIGDIVRALVTTNADDPTTIRAGNLYEVTTRPRHRNSGVIFVTDKESGNVMKEYSAAYFELVVAKEDRK